jgi:hypothetical protein
MSRRAFASVVLGGLACTVPLLLAIPQARVASLSWVPAIYLNAAQVLLSAVGVIVGFRGFFEIKRQQGRLRGKGLALAGILVNLGATVVLLPAVMLGLVLPTLIQARVQKQSMTNLHAIALALHKYHDEYGCFPPAAVFNHEGQPLYSWRVLLLPFLGQAKLYEQFRLDKSWDSPANNPLLAQMPEVYAPPGERFPSVGFATYYLVFDGPEAIFFSGSKPPWFDDAMNRARTPGFQVHPQRPGEQAVYAFGHRSTFSSIVDGPANTILLVEADDRVPWTKPQELLYAADQPLPKVGGHSHGDFLVALADGSVRIVRKTTSEKAIRAAITANGGEIPPPDWNEP